MSTISSATSGFAAAHIYTGSKPAAAKPVPAPAKAEPAEPANSSKALSVKA